MGGDRGRKDIERQCEKEKEREFMRHGHFEFYGKQYRKTKDRERCSKHHNKLPHTCMYAVAEGV